MCPVNDPPLLRENLIPSDFVGLSGVWTPCCHGRAGSESDRLCIVQSGGLRILVLRQQLAVYKRKSKKPILRNRDRLFWSLLSRFWKNWKSELILVSPETVIRWRKRKFRKFWRKNHRGSQGDRRFLMNTSASSGGYPPIIPSMAKIASPWRFPVSRSL